MNSGLQITFIIVCLLTCALFIRNAITMHRIDRKIRANKKKLDEETEKREQIEKDVIAYLHARGVLFKERDIRKMLIDCIEDFPIAQSHRRYQAVNIDKAAEKIAAHLNRTDVLLRKNSSTNLGSESVRASFPDAEQN